MAALRMAGAAVLMSVAMAGDSAAQALHGRCQQVLSHFSGSYHNHQELAVLCRAKAPQTVCTDALKSLGDKPWSSTDIDETCSMWLEDYETRLLRVNRQLGDDVKEDIKGSIPDVVKNVSETVNNKTNNATASVSDAMDKISEASDKLNEKLSEKVDDVSSSAGDVVKEAEKSLETDVIGKVELQRQPVAASRAFPLTLVCTLLGAAFMAVSLLVGAVLAVKRAYSQSSSSPMAGEEELLEGANAE